jgi:hypothetical protein
MLEGKRCCVCLKKEGFFSKFGQCAVCSQLVCSEHDEHFIDTKAVCDLCFQRVVVDTRRSYRSEHGEVLTLLSNELESLQFQREQLITEGTSLTKKLGEREEAVRKIKQQLQSNEALARMRHSKDEDHNETAQNQLRTIVKAYEQAKQSELETAQHQAKMLAVIDALKNEQSFVGQQKEQLTEQLQTANYQMTRLLNPTKFFEYACRPCKISFADAFRSELLRDRVDVDNLSFINASAEQERKQRDVCGCRLM